MSKLDRHPSKITLFLFTSIVYRFLLPSSTCILDGTQSTCVHTFCRLCNLWSGETDQAPFLILVIVKNIPIKISRNCPGIASVLHSANDIHSDKHFNLLASGLRQLHLYPRKRCSFIILKWHLSSRGFMRENVPNCSDKCNDLYNKNRLLQYRTINCTGSVCHKLCYSC